MIAPGIARLHARPEHGALIMDIAGLFSDERLLNKFKIADSSADIIQAISK